MNEETPSGGGSGTTHTTHGIVIQGLENDAETEEHAEYQVPKSKIRSFEADAEGPLPFARKSNAEPVSPVDDEVSTNTRFDETPVAHIIGHCSITLHCTRLEWMVVKDVGSGEQSNSVNDWLHEANSACHHRLCCATVKKCISTSMAVMQYTLITMDLAVAKIAYDIIWGDTDLYNKMIVNLGPNVPHNVFVLGALRKMISGSGFEDIVVESGLCASGSIDQVMSGKHYNRSVRVHQRMLDHALERLADVISQHN